MCPRNCLIYCFQTFFPLLIYLLPGKLFCFLSDGNNFFCFFLISQMHCRSTILYKQTCLVPMGAAVHTPLRLHTPVYIFKVMWGTLMVDMSSYIPGVKQQVLVMAIKNQKTLSASHCLSLSICAFCTQSRHFPLALVVLQIPLDTASLLSIIFQVLSNP